MGGELDLGGVSLHGWGGLLCGCGERCIGGVVCCMGGVSLYGWGGLLYGGRFAVWVGFRCKVGTFCCMGGTVRCMGGADCCVGGAFTI